MVLPGWVWRLPLAVGPTVLDGIGVRIMLSGMDVVSKVVLGLAVGSMSNGVEVSRTGGRDGSDCSGGWEA